MRDNKGIIVNLFNSKFNLKEFISFTNLIFKGNIRYKRNIEFSPKIKREFNSVIESFLDLGLYKDVNKRSMIVVVVKLKKEESVARSRTIQRNFIKDYFLKSGIDSALAVFYNEKSDDWRLSFIKLDYSYKNAKVEEDITPAKRFSFLLGKNENHHTAVERFLNLINNVNEFPTIEDLEEAFNIEVVTKEFFEKYCDLYLKIKKELDNQDGFEEVAKEAEIRSDEFAKKLMGQLVFLYFLQKKGWLGVGANPSDLSEEDAKKLLSNKSYDEIEVFKKVYTLQDNRYIRQDDIIETLSKYDIKYLNNIFINTVYDEKWGSGDKNFIRSMFIKANKSGKNFFKDYLEPIFYNALNDKRGGETYFKYLNCKIPFLNGGLFQPISDNYDYKNARFSLDNSLFSNTKKTKQGDIGDGVLDVFDRYAFTIKEDEPLEKEVAVDPEMLGKVFENLLDITDRKKKGAFYTPREIVHYMCQESLINYLITEVNISYDEAEALIRYGDIITDIDTSKSSVTTGDFKMPINVRRQAKLIDNALENVKIADPAVGSGAFPLGMVNEIVRARMNLTYYILDDLAIIGNTDKKDRTPYELKLKTIRRCIHAVDIERSAVDITKLRLWLALVVEENDFGNIKALPNLDYNIMVGNSLIEEFEGVKLFNEDILNNKTDIEDKKERLEQLSLLTGIEKNENLLEIIYQLERRLEGVTDKIEAYNLQKELEEAKKSYSEIAASIDLRRESEYILEEIYRLQEKFFEANSKDEKILLKKNIDSLEWLLIEKTIKENGKEELLDKIKEFKRTNTKPYFLWKLNFAKAFREKEGFDIVIGNPPYVGENGNKEIFRPIAKSEFGKRFYKGKMDLFYFFFHKAIDLSKEDGIISYITTNYFLTSDSAEKLRNDLKKRTTILKMINFNELKIFESASGQHNIITFLRKNTNNDFKAKLCISKRNNSASLEDLQKIFSFNDDESIYINKKQEELYDDNNNISFVNNDNRIIKRILLEQNFKLLDEEIGNGIDILQENVTDKHIKIMPNLIKGEGVFALNDLEVNKLKLTKKEQNIIKPYFYSKQLLKYGVCGNTDKYIIYTNKMICKEIDNYPNIKSHLDKFKAIITSDNKPYGLHRARDENFFKETKILSLRMTKEPIFTYSNEDSYVTRAYLSIKTKRVNLKYLTGILNSRLIYYWLFHKGKRKGKQLQIDKNPLVNIPIKVGDINQQNQLINIVDSLIKITRNKVNYTCSEFNILFNQLENQLNDIVNSIYNLDEYEKADLIKFKAE